MSVTDLHKDLEAGTLTIVTQYSATAERIWELWVNPRQLERWWGPPSYPATVTDHDFSPGGLVRYYMTGPDGDQHHGGWRVVSSQAPHRLEFQDYFADPDGNEESGLPVSTTIVTISEQPGGLTEMVIETQYASPGDLTKVLEMGMEQGIRGALDQIDDLLAESTRV